MLEQGTITIHTQNIFPIIKKSLYSDHEVFFRELVSNGVDAIQKLKMVGYAGETELGDFQPEIHIAIDREKRTLSISDNGIGMTADEVKKYINQVAFSSAEEFVQKYQGTDQPLIGHFGLGFYSAFMVAQQVEIDTLSYKNDAQAVHWTCSGSPEFSLESSERSERGTTVILTLSEGEDEYLDPNRIRQLVKKYCDFMPVAIKLDGEVINRQKAIWRESASNLTAEDYQEFYRYLYPFQEEPLLWVHLQTDYPFLLNGILYFPKMQPDIDVTRSELKLFCNQVYVSDHCEEIIPRFLLPMRGVIDSPDIPLNVSRSALQMDRTVRRIGDFIAKKVGDRLQELYQNDFVQYAKIWPDLSLFIKYGYLNDEKFKKQVQEIIIHRTTAQLSAQGESDIWQEGVSKSPYTTLNNYLERAKVRHENRVFYATDQVAQTTYITLHQNQGLEVLFLDSFIDTHFISYLERDYPDVKFVRVDADLDSSLIDANKAAEIVDPKTNKTRSELVQEVFKQYLDKPKVTIRTESLSGTAPPAMILLPEALRRLRDMTALLQQQKAEFPEEHTLVINTAHPLVENLVSLSQGGIIVQSGGNSPRQELTQNLCQHIYDLALMAQKGFDPETMQSFLDRASTVLTRLTTPGAI
ncbi:Heat shock protein Hsp90 [Gloeomargarita lithophora Alchichica-D10]|uniref:Heat shock protein Hsp90 n=1 Tax=Gloeomargarita lithophora Alchichica-D10 TaxID=1188229 RepID=A0A1J0AFL8_9CYAN|nr:molecular chaperone HtpG [Gloeomargarita lithophora]APB34717.1 Heat shock protein Hsp90 [Gloeomargarita lithophora Alchichica-D10]